MCGCDRDRRAASLLYGITMAFGNLQAAAGRGYPSKIATLATGDYARSTWNDASVCFDMERCVPALGERTCSDNFSMPILVNWYGDHRSPSSLSRSVERLRGLAMREEEAPQSLLELDHSAGRIPPDRSV